MKTRVAILTTTFLLAIAALGSAQSYDLKIYAPGGAVAISSTPLPIVDIACNQTAPASTVSNVNPNRAVWDDTLSAGKVCIWTPGTSTASPLVALPIGPYEAVLTYSDITGTSADSNRASFSRAPLPAARTGVKLYRQGS